MTPAEGRPLRGGPRKPVRPDQRLRPVAREPRQRLLLGRQSHGQRLLGLQLGRPVDVAGRRPQAEVAIQERVERPAVILAVVVRARVGVAVALKPRRGAQRPTETVDQVLDKFVQALGGREAVAKMKTRTRTGTVTNRANVTANVTVEDTAAGQIRTSVDAQPAASAKAPARSMPRGVPAETLHPRMTPS